MRIKRVSKMQLRRMTIRTLVYIILTLAVWMIIYTDVRWPFTDSGQKFTEQSYTEYVQEIILFIVAGLFFLTAVLAPRKRSFGLLMTAFFTLALIRELDGFFDGILHGFWKAPCLFATVGFGGLFYRYKENFMHDVLEFIERREFGIFICGFLTVFVFSRLFGSKILWDPLMAGGYVRSVKNMAEEGMELFGYLFFLIAAVEYYVFKINQTDRESLDSTNQNEAQRAWFFR